MHGGVDIGGAFTDIGLRLLDGTLRVSKVSSTPEDPGLAVVTGLAALLRAAGVEPREVTEIVHGTTVASNTIIKKTGAVTGFITPRGFRDVLEIGRVRTPDLYDLTWEKPAPLVPRRRRLEVDERMAADGAVVRALDEAGVVRAAERLAVAEDVRDERISLEFARREHGVVVDPVTLAVDLAATRPARSGRA